MDAILLIDFGSTYTKLTLVDSSKDVVLATAKDLTTVETDVMDGYQRAFAKLMDKLPGINVQIVETLACSSAAGGLKMVAIGLVPELTVEAAKRAALGAGARVLDVYGYELSKYEMKQIAAMNPDILLLAGGTDGGNKACILHNARMIAEHLSHVPVIVAGNQRAHAEIEELFEAHGLYFQITQNVMPRLNMLQVEPSREVIRNVFMEKIVEAKGINKAELIISNVLMPTPAAVLEAAQLLADGTENEPGLGSLMVLDIGGATTDIHSIGEGAPTQSGVVMTGLQEPYAKRTVEGDLGMRVSAAALWEAAGAKQIRKWAPDLDIDIESRCRYLADNVQAVPRSETEAAFDAALAKVASELAMERHVGELQSFYSTNGTVYSQTGKDMMESKYVLATGGVIVHSPDPESIVRAGFFNPQTPQFLKPRQPDILLDEHYILSAMGLLAQRDPDQALRIMKKYMVPAQVEV